MSADITIRAATARDQHDIAALVRSERLNPNDLHWPRFVVASAGPTLVGAVQMRHHTDGSRELGSLVVHPRFRGRGIAQRMVNHLLAQYEAPVHLVTARTRAPYFARWQFHGIAPRQAPRAVRRNHWLGQFGGALVSLLLGRWPRRLVILART